MKGLNFVPSRISSARIELAADVYADTLLKMEQALYEWELANDAIANSDPDEVPLRAYADRNLAWDKYKEAQGLYDIIQEVLSK